MVTFFVSSPKVRTGGSKMRRRRILEPPIPHIFGEDTSNVTVEIRGNQQCTTDDEPGDTADRCFDITASGMAIITFHYLADELDGLTANQIEAWHWNGSG